MRADKKRVAVVAALAAALVAAVIPALLCGTVFIGPGEFFALFSGEPLSKAGQILMHLRLPRVAAALVAGVGLSYAGVVIQTVLNNPLAGPNIIGVNSGAGFFTVLCGALFPGMYRLLPAAAFVGAFLTVLLVCFLGKKTGQSRVALVLAGMAINSLLNSATDMVYVLNDSAVVSSKLFRIGGLAGVNVQVLTVAAGIVALAFAATTAFAGRLEILSLGEETARSLGLSAGRWRLIFLVLAALLAGASVSFAGLIGFVGLIVPHIARLLVGDETGPLLVSSALLGALLVVLCDTLARTLFRPYEIPVGILLSFLGVPFFIWLLASRKRSVSDA